MDRWNDFRSALGIPVSEVKELYNQIKQDHNSDEMAFSNLIYIWISKNPKNCTFGVLIDVLARQLEFLETASKHAYKIK
jgi:hypothetical protein